MPTRTSNSVETDTSPDLSWHKGQTTIDWETTLENLGSDHSILIITLHQNIKTTTHTNQITHITNWDALRQSLIQNKAATTVDHLTEQLRWVHKLHTKHIRCTEDAQQVDMHLVHNWDKRHHLLQRWKRNNENRSLKKRILDVTHEAQEYVTQLATQDCLDTCSNLNGKLHTVRVWQLLRGLLGPLGQSRPKHTMNFCTPLILATRYHLQY